MSRFIVWVGAAVFAASLVSFAVVYELVLGTAAPAGSATRAVLVNTGLFTLFALHHSVMARSGAKAWITRVVPEALERSFYVWAASVLFVAVCWLWQPLPGMAWDAGKELSIALRLVQLAGVALTLVAARMIDVLELAGVRQASHGAPMTFMASGPFGLVRHPIYLGWVLIVFASPEMSASKLLFATISTAYLLAAIPWEEASLVASHGDRYRTYQQQVRARLVPGVW